MADGEAAAPDEHRREGRKPLWTDEVRRRDLRFRKKWWRTSGRKQGEEGSSKRM